MSVSRKKNSEKTPQDQLIAQAIQQAVGELYGEHAAEIRAVLEDSEDRKVTVNFASVLDCSESEPVVTITLRFSTSVTDKRTARLDDPAQITLFGDKSELPDKGGEQPELAEEKKGRRVKKITEEIAEQAEE